VLSPSALALGCESLGTFSTRLSPEQAQLGDAANITAGEVEQLGEVDCPSGILLILDGKVARIWSRDRQGFCRVISI